VVQSSEVSGLRLYPELPDFGYVSLCAGLEQFLWGQFRRVHGLVVADIYVILRQGRQHEFVLPAVSGEYICFVIIPILLCVPRHTRSTKLPSDIVSYLASPLRKVESPFILVVWGGGYQC